MAVLDRIERALASSTLSLFCVCLVLVWLGLPFWVAFAILIPFNNYAHKLEQLHAQVDGPGTDETAQTGSGPKDGQRGGRQAMRPTSTSHTNLKETGK